MVLSEFAEIMEHVRCHIVWVGDFNAHNALWGSDSKDNNEVVRKIPG